MRKQWLAAIAVLAILGGCDSASNPGNGSGKNGEPAAPAIAEGTTLNGTVTFQDQIPVAEGSKLDAKLVDAAQPDVALAQKTFDVGGTPPFKFALDFDRSKIAPDRYYIVRTVLTDGPRRFLPALNSPVLTHGSGIDVQVVMKAEATPAELIKEDYKKLQTRIGAMKKVNGVYTTDNASIAWDAFSEGGKVRFVRLTSLADAGGKTSYKYAYTKDGKVMYALQTGGATIGWNDKGEALVNEKPGGAKSSDDEIKSMADAAQKAFESAQAKVDAAKRK